MPDTRPPAEGEGEGYANAERPREDEKERVQVAGAFVMCPMVARMSLPGHQVESEGC